MRLTWRAAVVKAGVSVSLYEGTKHAPSTAIKAAGVDDRVIADLFGHSKARSAPLYAQVQTDVVRNAPGKPRSDPL
jgi:site-specific recombinase XerD